MLRLSLRNIAARGRRLFTTGMAIVLGVAFLVGTLVFTDTLSRLFSDLFSTSYQGTDAWVRGEVAFKDEFDSQRPLLAPEIVARARDTDGVAAAEGAVQGFAQLVNKKGKAVGAAGGAPSFGFNWVGDDELNAYDVSEGVAPRDAGDIVIDRDLAKRAKVRIGDTVKVLTQVQTEQFRITGIATFAGRDSAAGSSAIFFETATAQRLFDKAGKFDGIFVRADEGVGQAVIVSRLRAELADTTPTLEVITGRALTKESEEQLTDGFVGPFRNFLVAFAAIALFVGIYVIANTFAILVAQRTREMALLRAVGASRRQVSGAVAIEALALGLVASLMGCLLGIGLAFLLKFAFGKVGVSLPDQGLKIQPSTILLGVVVGVGATVLSAVWPAVRAGRTPPLAAMRSVAVDRSATSRGRFIAGLAVLGVSAALTVFGLTRNGSAPLVLVGLGLVVAFVGVTVVGPVLVVPLTKLFGAPVRAFRGAPGQMAVENAIRSPRRTSATAMALAVGVGVVTTILVLATSLKQSFTTVFSEQVTADLTVSASSQFQFGFSPAVEPIVAGVPGVAAYSGLRFGTVRIDGDRKSISAIRPEGVGELLDLGRVNGDLAGLGSDGIAVADEVAEKNNWKLGDTLPVEFSRSGLTPKPFVIRALYERAELVHNYVISDSAYKANFTDVFLAQVLVKRSPNVSSDTLRARLDAALDAYPSTTVQDREEFLGTQVAFINQALSIVYALLGLSVFIALIGIRNTLSLSVLERTRELGLLRAVGMSRRQMRSTVRWEAVIVALIGTVFGMIVGVAFGSAIVQAARRAGEITLAIPVGSLVIVAIVGAFAGALSARKPSRRAAKLDILQAIATE